MNSLAVFGVMDVFVLDGNLVRMCGSHLCHQIFIVQQQSNNASICRKCTKEKWRDTKADERRQKNWDLQVAADSRTKWGSLSEAQKKERNGNNRQVKGSMKRKLKRLELL